MEQNKMGVMPINKLLVTMSLPMVASMLVQALYNIVDSYFVSLVSRDALTAVSQAFSAQNLMIGIATGTAVGMNALISRALGQGDRERANKIASNGVFLAIVSYVAMLLFGLFGTDLYFSGMLAAGGEQDALINIENVRAYGNDYLSICMIFSFGVYGQIVFERIMQSTGRTVYTMYTQGLGAVINIILDPIFILDDIPVIGGLGMGAAGAAWATVIGQIAAAILAMILNAKYNPEIVVRLKDVFKPSGKIIGSIYSIGVPSIIMVAIGSVMNYLMNVIIMGVSAVGTTIFGVYYKLQSFVFMPVFGFNNGLIPIIAFNYGAQNRKRMMATVKYALIYIVSIMLLGLVIMQTIPSVLLGLFESDPAVIEMGCVALRSISLSFIFAGVCIALSSVFQALGYGTYSMLVSFARQLVVLVPVAYLFSLSGRLDLIWYAFPIAEIMSLAVTILLFIRIYKRTIKKVPLEAN